MSASYLSSHPWITFSLNLEKISAPLWSMLGECQAMCEYMAGTPLNPELAHRLHQLYLAKGVLATTAIEGNTLTEEDALELVRGTLKLPPSKEYLAQEMENIIRRCNILLEEIEAGTITHITAQKIKEHNKYILENLPLEEGVIPGKVKSQDNYVARYRGAPKEDCELLLEKLCDWLNNEFRAFENMQIVFAIIKAVVSHIYLAWIHAFDDGNGRTARIIEFQILLSSGIPAPASQLLSNHYNKTRNEYYRQLDFASKSNGNIIPFLHYAIKGYKDELAEQIQEIQSQQADVFWRDYIHRQFGDDLHAPDERRKNLALAIAKLSTPVPRSKIQLISPKVAMDYARKSALTLDRDIEKLESMKLIKRTSDGIFSNKDLIYAFLPLRVG